MEWDAMGCDAIGWDVMGRDAMGCDAMGCDVMGRDAMGCEVMGWDPMRWARSKIPPGSCSYKLVFYNNYCLRLLMRSVLIKVEIGCCCYQRNGIFTHLANILRKQKLIISDSLS